MLFMNRWETLSRCTMFSQRGLAVYRLFTDMHLWSVRPFQQRLLHQLPRGSRGPFAIDLWVSPKACRDTSCERRTHSCSTMFHKGKLGAASSEIQRLVMFQGLATLKCGENVTRQLGLVLLFCGYIILEFYFLHVFIPL